jgi:uncharacterized protein YijF (DUF1287 family)
MALDPSKYRVTGDTEFTPELWNRVMEQFALAIVEIQEKATSFDEATKQLIQTALFRINEALAPAFELVLDYQTGGFLTAPIVENSEVAFQTGNGTLAIDPSKRGLFRPSPFIALTRASTTADVAIAQTLGYDPETGALEYTVHSVTGSAGPHDDVIVAAVAGSVQAQLQFLTETKAARDKAKDWAEKADGQNVDGSGTRSAKHHAGQAAASAVAASGSASTASGHATTANTAKNDAITARNAAQAAVPAAEAWAENAEDAEVEAGKYSAKHYAAKAAQSAEDAATFDPATYAPKASPALTGTPTAPTATGGTNTTQIATTAYVMAALAALIGGATPSTLDTLQEIADALGDDPNFATTITGLIAGKANASHTHPVADLSDATANGRSLITAANYAAMRTLLGLVVGTNVQAYDADTALLDVAQTWTAAQLFGQIGGVTTAVPSLAIDCSAGNHFSKTIAGSSTFTTSNVPSSRSYGFSLRLTYTSGTITWFSGVNWVDASAPVLTGGKVYLVLFHTDNGGSTWRAACMEFAA